MSPNTLPSPRSFTQIAAARQRGQRVIGEPVASGLALTDEKLWNPDFSQAAQYVMSPPIRGELHRQALKKVRSVCERTCVCVCGWLGEGRRRGGRGDCVWNLDLSQAVRHVMSPPIMHDSFTHTGTS